MDSSISRRLWQLMGVRIHGLVVLSVVVLALLGRPVEGQEGWWVSGPPVAVVATGCQNGRRQRRGGRRGQKGAWWMGWQWAGLRSLLLWGLWRQGEQACWWWPWAWWSWQCVGRRWPGIRRWPEWRAVGWLLWQGQRVLVVVGLAVVVKELATGQGLAWQPAATGMEVGPLALGCILCEGDEPHVTVEGTEAGGYQATLCGHFTVTVAAEARVKQRLLMLFLRWLEVPGAQRRSRRTRDGRTPFVRQQPLAKAFGLPQPVLSRIEGYWVRENWPNLLSESSEEILTPALRNRIVTLFARFPWWSRRQVYEHLHAQGVAVTRSQVRQAAEQSGWALLRRELSQRYQWTAEDFRPQNGWLTAQLLTQMESLLGHLERGEPLTSQVQVAIADLQALTQELDLQPAAQPPVRTLPWLVRIERVVFDHWQALDDQEVPHQHVPIP